MKNPPHKRFSFSVVGSGNLAWHLSHALVNVGHKLNEVYSRNKSTATELAKELNGKYHDTTDFSGSKCHFLILAVPDSAVLEIASAIILQPNVILIIVSGSIPLQQLCSIRNQSAVLYPLQTFTAKSKIDFDEMPIFIEAHDPGVLRLIKILASTISQNVMELDSEKREKVHLAAVFACNFTNHLFSISQGILEKENLDFHILKPLVMETIRKAFLIGPAKSQTGPAVRGDYSTLERHLQLLHGEESIKNIYHQISTQISNTVKNS